MKQIKDAGFLYDSSLMASDDAYEILVDRQPVYRVLSCGGYSCTSRAIHKARWRNFVNAWRFGRPWWKHIPMMSFTNAT